jgi:hypothetical protein
MKSKHMVSVGLWLGAIALLGTAVVAQAASASAKSEDESHHAARLLRAIRSDAVQVRSAAAQLNRLTNRPSATWLDYDGQWNAIKPAVEDMQMKLARLESLQASLSPAQRQEIDQSKSMIEQIQGGTHQLRVLLDKPGVQTNNVQFKDYARRLRNEAAKLEQTSTAS